MARKLSAFRHFYKYLLLDRIITEDPTLNIETPKQWKVLPKALSRDEAEQVMKADRPPTDSKLAAALWSRDKAMMEMLYAGGLRVSELVNLKLEDVKLDLGYALVRGKGDKDRVVPDGTSRHGCGFTNICRNHACSWRRGSTRLTSSSPAARKR